jgi:hypothetical protein
MQALRSDCTACGGDGHYTVLLAVGPHADRDDVRYFIPNQAAREEQGSGLDPVKQITFCKSCMREIEGAMRGTIARLQEENSVTPSTYASYQ